MAEMVVSIRNKGSVPIRVEIWIQRHGESFLSPDDETLYPAEGRDFKLPLGHSIEVHEVIE